jgi:hypothetical protein
VGPQPSLQFKGNGVLYVCKGVNDSRVGWAGYPFFAKEQTPSPVSYSLAFSNFKNDDWLYSFPNTSNQVTGSIYFLKTNLNIGTYSNDDMAIDFENLNYHYEVNPNRLTFKVTSINNGLASGTFSGTLPAGPISSFDPNRGPQMNITDGVFTNIPVFE